MSDQTDQQGEMVIYICSDCRERNLTDQTQFNNCIKCNEVYCLHYASTIDPRYCTNCLHDVKVTEEIIKKTESHYNEQTDKVYSRTRTAKRIVLGGMHWLFQSRKISTLTDLELEIAIEYHRDLLSQMLYEREERRAKKAHRNAGVKINFVGSVKTTTSESIEVKFKKVKQAVKNDPNQKLADALAQLQQLGYSADMIAKMVSGRK